MYNKKQQQILVCQPMFFLFTMLCLGIANRPQVVYSTCCCLCDHPFKY